MQIQLSQLLGKPDPPTAPKAVPAENRANRREGGRSKSRAERTGLSQETNFQTWVEATRQGKKTAPTSQASRPRNAGQIKEGSKPSGTKFASRQQGQRGEKPRKRRPPKAAAVAIRCSQAQEQDASPPSYADIIRTAKAQVTLETLGITDVRIHREEGSL